MDGPKSFREVLRQIEQFFLGLSAGQRLLLLGGGVAGARGDRFVSSNSDRKDARHSSNLRAFLHSLLAASGEPVCLPHGRRHEHISAAG